MNVSTEDSLGTVGPSRHAFRYGVFTVKKSLPHVLNTAGFRPIRPVMRFSLIQMPVV